MKPALITTSWDDGAPLDLRLAGLLASRGLLGTFYVPISRGDKQLLDRAQMRELLDMGMEIGSHTLTHPVLSELDTAQLDREMRESKQRLEDTLGRPVPSFCYPKGKYNALVRQRAMRAGYALCRTTRGFHLGSEFDPAEMHCSFQVFPHRRDLLLRNALHQGNFQGAWTWLRRFGGENDPAALARSMANVVAREGGILHLWGHSWEMEKFGLWSLLERVLDAACQAGLTPVTNFGALPRATA